MKKWEPNFRALTATSSSVAVWLRMPERPVEYFDAKLLRQITRSIGPLLRIDSHTLAGDRGRYARLCVQLDVEKPLPKSIAVDCFSSVHLLRGHQPTLFPLWAYMVCPTNIAKISIGQPAPSPDLVTPEEYGSTKEAAQKANIPISGCRLW